VFAADFKAPKRLRENIPFKIESRRGRPLTEPSRGEFSNRLPSPLCDFIAVIFKTRKPDLAINLRHLALSPISNWIR
jgi:hypothetical protein